MAGKGTDLSLPPLVVISGPTASGKTALALELAERYAVEVVSADSRQVYRQLDIGTAKATAEEREKVQHHLLDVVDPDQDFSVADFVGLAGQAVADIHGRGKLPLLVGGTGLYIKALIDGLASTPRGDAGIRQQLLEQERAEPGALFRRLQLVDPASAERLPSADQLRIVRALEVFTLTGIPLSRWQSEHRFEQRAYRVMTLGLSPDRQELYNYINKRVESMMATGLVEETRGVLQRGFSPDLKAFKRDTRRYAKRQLTWFRKEKSTIWVDSQREFARIQTLIDYFMQPKRSGHG